MNKVGLAEQVRREATMMAYDMANGGYRFNSQLVFPGRTSSYLQLIWSMVATTAAANEYDLVTETSPGGFGNTSSPRGRCSIGYGHSHPGSVIQPRRQIILCNRGLNLPMRPVAGGGDSATGTFIHEIFHFIGIDAHRSLDPATDPYKYEEQFNAYHRR